MENLDDERPSVAFVSCVSENSASLLLEEILGGSDAKTNKPWEICSNIFAFELNLATKYYSANVRLCRITDKTIGEEKFSDSVGAAILFFDGECLEPLKSWMSFVNHWDPGTRILVCETLACPDVNKWCIENSFETVELNPSDETKAELEEYGEAFGVPRILQILKSHPWSNAQMKEGQDAANSARLRKYLTELDQEDALHMTEISDETVHELAEKLAEGGVTTETWSVSVEKPDSSKLRDELLDDKRGDENLFGAVNGGEDPGEVSFEELFGQFESMKKQAENLPEEERKAYAEKVVTAFWKSIGGDEEEVAGLSSDGEKDAEFT